MQKRESNVAQFPEQKQVRLVSLDDLMHMARPRPLISGLLYSDMEHVLFGPQGTAKTFLALDWCLHMAYQRRWMGLPVQHARVVYICGEGGGVMVADRINAWLTHHEISDATAANELLRVTTEPVPMLDDEWVDVLIRDVAADGGADFVAIDTLAANFGSGDENASADMRAFCAAMRRLRLRLNGAGVMAIHHTGHMDKSRPQGSNMLRRNVDIELRVDRDASDASLLAVMGGGELKSRHGKGCGLIPFQLQGVRLSVSDSLGQPVESACVVATQETPSFEGAKAVNSRRGKNQNKALAVLKALTADADAERDDGVFVASADFNTACVEAGIDRRRQAEVRKSFAAKGWIVESVGGFKWFPV